MMRRKWQLLFSRWLPSGRKPTYARDALAAKKKDPVRSYDSNRINLIASSAAESPATARHGGTESASADRPPFNASTFQRFNPFYIALPAWLSSIRWQSPITEFMKTKIDIKSAFIGLGVGILVAVGVAAASSSGSVGRYQIAGTGNHGLIIDTVTGQVWRGYFSSDLGNTDGDFFAPKNNEKK
jgi:hypothetical protein